MVHSQGMPSPLVFVAGGVGSTQRRRYQRVCVAVAPVVCTVARIGAGLRYCEGLRFPSVCTFNPAAQARYGRIATTPYFVK